MRCSPSTLSYLAQHGDLEAARALRDAGFAADLAPITRAIEETRDAARQYGIRLEPCIFAALAQTEPPMRPLRTRKLARPWWPDGVPHPDARIDGAR